MVLIQTVWANSVVGRLTTKETTAPAASVTVREAGVIVQLPGTPRTGVSASGAPVEPPASEGPRISPTFAPGATPSSQAIGI